jgi:hypothetical protein
MAGTRQRDQPGFYRCGEGTTSTSRASTGVAGTRNRQPGFYRNNGVPTGLLPVWQEGVVRTANQPGFYRCDGGISSKTAPTGLLPVWAGVAGRLGSVLRTPFLDLLGGNQHKQEKVHK